MKILNSKKKIVVFYIKKNSNIIGAISKLDDVKSKFVLGVDNKSLFQGVLNDGDIRRGILQGINIDDKISKIYNKKPIFFNKSLTPIKSEKIFKDKKINFFPIINNKRVKEIFVNEEFNKSKLDNKLVVMAGGKGPRLGKFTKYIPSPMLKIKWKTDLED